VVAEQVLRLVANTETPILDTIGEGCYLAIWETACSECQEEAYPWRMCLTDLQHCEVHLQPGEMKTDNEVEDERRGGTGGHPRQKHSQGSCRYTQCSEGRQCR
jgi:hypothetical protein